MTSKNYYEKFGLRQNATDAEIKKAYRKLALKYHPDKNDGNPKFDNIFKQINEIYDTLTDNIKRQAYDATLKEKMNGSSTTDFHTSANMDESSRETYKHYNASTHRNNDTPKENDFAFKIPSEVKNFFTTILGWGVLISVFVLLGTIGDWIFGSSKNSEQLNNIENSAKYETTDTSVQTGEINFGDLNSRNYGTKDSAKTYRNTVKSPQKQNLANEATQTNTGEINFK